MQISRLFEIIYILLEKGTTTARELAEHFEVSVRTIYRDVDALCQAGIPVYASQGKGGGITLMDEFVLNKSLLSEKEQNEILLALQNLSATRYPDVDGVLDKLGGLFKKGRSNWIEVDFSPWGSDEKQKEAFSHLKYAILHQRVIVFSYFNVSGEKRDRRVEPLKLLFKDKAWYLRGYCLDRGAMRTFKITRMTGIRVTGEPCDPNRLEEVLAPSEEKPHPDLVPLKLKISPQGAYRVYDDFDESDIQKHGDGSFTADVSLPGGEWLYSYLLSFGLALEVLAPPGVREEMGQRLSTLAEKYRNTGPP